MHHQSNQRPPTRPVSSAPSLGINHEELSPLSVSISPDAAGETAQARLIRHSREHIRELKGEGIHYIFNQEFLDTDRHALFLQPVSFTREQLRGSRPPPGAQPEIVQLYEAGAPLLTREQEYHLFRQYNFLKWQASEALRNLILDAAPVQNIDEVRELLKWADETRNQIVVCNRRLAMSCVKRYADQHALGFLQSEGDVALLKAVEGFDYGRGFKFATYATGVIHKQLYAALPRELNQALHSQNPAEINLDACSDVRQEERESREATVLSSREFLDNLLQKVEPRERSFVRERYGADGSGEERTLREVAAANKVSHELVRQIVSDTLAKLARIVRFGRVPVPSDIRSRYHIPE